MPAKWAVLQSFSTSNEPPPRLEGGVGFQLCEAVCALVEFGLAVAVFAPSKQLRRRARAPVLCNQLQIPRPKYQPLDPKDHIARLFHSIHTGFTP